MTAAPERMRESAMSEYQYYEFLALDRPLTEAECLEVRALSTSADVSRTRFVNEYHWGDFRGNAASMMDRYYDAHLYFANWGSRVLMLRLPLSLLNLETAELYSGGDYARVRTSGANVILEWESESEDGGEDWVEDGSGPLAALIGVRAELAAGDLRPLYLGWLASLGMESGDWEDAEYWDGDGGGDEDEGERGAALEPPVPAGLGTLTAAQLALAEFLRVDGDLLKAAAVVSPKVERSDPAHRQNSVDEWIRGLTVEQKDEAIRQLLSGDDSHVRTEMLRAVQPPARVSDSPRRTVATLVAAAAGHASIREGARQEELAKQQATRMEQAQRDIEQRLESLASQGERAWKEVTSLVVTKDARSYDDAVRLLTALELSSQRGGDRAAFAKRIADLRAVHQRKSSFIDRLDAAGLP